MYDCFFSIDWLGEKGGEKNPPFFGKWGGYQIINHT